MTLLPELKNCIRKYGCKLADRITNLQHPPPNWSNEKRLKYHEQTRTILRELGDGNAFLAKRLGFKIEDYGNYISK